MEEALILIEKRKEYDKNKKGKKEMSKTDDKIKSLNITLPKNTYTHTHTHYVDQHNW